MYIKLEKYIYVLIFLFIISGCHITREDYKHKELLEVVKKQNPEDQDNIYSDIWVFLRTREKNTYAYTDIYSMQREYAVTEKYHHLPYPEFITLTITGELEVEGGGMFRCFTLNDTIVSFYETHSLDYFLYTYTDKLSEKEDYRIKNKLSLNAVLTVLFCLYQNEYYSMENDNIGGYFTRPLDGWTTAQEYIKEE